MNVPGACYDVGGRIRQAAAVASWRSPNRMPTGWSGN